MKKHSYINFRGLSSGRRFRYDEAMTKRQVVVAVLQGGKPLCVPWSFRFTKEAGQALARHHILELGSDIGFAPAHAVESDVTLANMPAFIDAARNQAGFI